MVLEHVKIFCGVQGFLPGMVEICGDRFEKVELYGPDSEETDSYMLPGLVDIHTHGNSGYDFSDGDEQGLRCMGRYLAAHGITSFLPASMTLPYNKLDLAFQSAGRYRDAREQGAARIQGIHMEGPFFSEKKKGAQNSRYLQLPDAAAVKALNESCGGLIRIVDVAPELPGALDFTRELTENETGRLRVSVAHTDAFYEEAKAIFEAGATHVTHLFNAMPGIHHRKPGVIGAAAEEEKVTAELICDGQHIHPSIVRLAFRLFPGRLCLISDALRCCGMPDGQYELGGQQVTLKDQMAVLADGTLAGAAVNLFDDLKNAIRFGIPVEEAVMAATIVPARAAGCDHETGSIEIGKFADFILCDRELNIRQVYIGGKPV